MNLRNAAECVVSGEISIHATWTEDIYFRDPDGAAMDISALDFQFQFRDDPSKTGADVTLSIDSGELSIVEDSGSVDSILRITVDPARFSAYPGNMVADLIAIDTGGNVTHYAHGVVTFCNDPVAV